MFHPLVQRDGLSDLGAIMSLADTCGAVVMAQYYSRFNFYDRNTCVPSFSTRVVPKVMSNFFLQTNWEQQTKENMVVDGTSCCVILNFL